ncbi:hypothetical protein DB346_00655 [Verrucomicrobia bacterium LW23]|nr:hypothetical protein DB346_00655 [Verrucomicrobia bacterium LW23]
MIRALALSLLAALAFFPLAPITATAEPVASEELGVSFEVPSEWKVITNKQVSKYPIALGPKEADFTANINMVNEEFGGNINDYVEANMRTLRKEFKNLKEVDSSKFTTDSGVEGWRVITEHDTFGKDLRQSFFFFKSLKGKNYLVITTSSLTSVGAQLQPTFDKILKTVTLAP